MDEQELRAAAADLRQKAKQMRKKNELYFNTLDSAERLEHYADQMKAEREALPAVTKSIQNWFAKGRR